MRRRNWMLGFLGFLGFMGFQGIVGLAKGDWLEAVYVLWFSFFAWFVNFLPEKGTQKVPDPGPPPSHPGTRE
ncbi:MAG TPA: DUF3796 domain-containing protein [Methanomicrobiales archaeon]|nr:DUF3796 domain-containing protein [Methanomicrobiales archaeon]